MEYELSVTFLIGVYALGWFWVKGVKDYFRGRKMRLGISERLVKVTYIHNYE